MWFYFKRRGMQQRPLGVVSIVAPERRTWPGASLAPYIRLDGNLQPTAAGGTFIHAHCSAVGFPYQSAPSFLLLDRDAQYGLEGPIAVRSMAVSAIRTSFRSP